MRRLSLYLKNKLIKSVSLDGTSSVSVGRQTDCTLVVDDHTISREHLLFSFEEDNWKIICKSRFDFLEDESGNKVKELILPKEEYEVSLGKYKLLVEEEKTQNEEPEENLENEIVPEQIEENLEEAIQAEGKEKDQEEEITQEVELDPSNLTPFLTFSILGRTKSIELEEKETWIFGRDKKCDIKLDYQKLSGKHFKIRKDLTKYYISDLKSKNGTNLNGLDLSPNKEVELISGSVITVKELKIQFEIKDSCLHNELVAISEAQPNFDIENEEAITSSGAVRIPVQKPKKNKRVKIIAAIFILIALLSLLKKEDKPATMEEESRTPAAVKQNDTYTNSFDALDEVQKQLVINSYELANKMYKESKYNIAISEIQKIHELIDSYKDSKMIESLSASAISTLKQQEEIEKMEKQQEMLKQKVQSIVSNCEKMSSSTNKAEVQACLEKAIEIDPENSRAQSLLSTIDQNIAEKKTKRDKRNRQKQSIRMGENLFKRAKNLEKKERYLDAIDAYNKHLKSNYSDPKNLKTQSKKAIAKIKASLKSIITSNIKKADGSASRGDYKSAITALRKNLYLDPQHDSSTSKITRYNALLKKKTRSLYQDAILEENMGNLESAKGKWQRILEIDIPDGEYINKSRLKLKKYGL